MIKKLEKLNQNELLVNPNYMESIIEHLIEK